MSGGARRGSPASSALSLLLLIAPLLAFAPAALASVPRDATALSSPSLAADVGALAAPPLEHTESAAFRVFAGDELGTAHLPRFEPSYPETRVGGFGLPDEARVGALRSLRLEAPWACDGRSGGRASGSGEFRIFDPAGVSRSASAFGWNRLFQGREHLGFVDAYDFRARTLWPEIGRFGQEDPAGFLDSANLYQALRGAFVSRVDPSGRSAFDPIDTELPEILERVQKAADEAARRFGLRTIEEVTQGGSLGMKVHAEMQALLGPGGKYFHPRIATEVEVDNVGRLLATGSRRFAEADALVKDVVILKPGFNVQRLKPGHFMSRASDWVVDLKVGGRGAKLRSLDTLQRLGVRPIPFKPHGTLPQDFLGQALRRGIVEASEDGKVFRGTGKTARYIGTVGRVVKVLAIGGVIAAFPARAEQDGYAHAGIQSAYDLIPFSVITDGLVYATEFVMPSSTEDEMRRVEAFTRARTP